ncbi:hypothetical protein KBI52_10960 [Microvirga sp. HBU67558]|uniref:hypothetical protein n=1 Tax=Microvirga sp. HBU67558 TaxID=2824562 RepID=UPI001B39A8A2|nr:hypothetical protein [Microvirga sp. HBU67558]MBQ0820725.1 hypothetical protein [Microvirga sp. HBU67558]
MAGAKHILTNYDRREALSLSQAAFLANRTVETVRGWAANRDIGRKVAGRWAVSHPCLLMLLESDQAALEAYWAGDRQSEIVTKYFQRAGVPVKGAA